MWAEGRRESGWKDLRSRLMSTLPRIPQLGDWGVAQHLPVMRSRFLSQHRKIKKVPQSAHRVWVSQHLKGRSRPRPSLFQALGPVTSTAPSDTQKNQVHPEFLGTSLSLDHRPLRSKGQPWWGWSQPDSAHPTPTTASFRTKAGSADPLSPLCILLF